jgi:hypothetical protein
VPSVLAHDPGILLHAEHFEARRPQKAKLFSVTAADIQSAGLGARMRFQEI